MATTLTSAGMIFNDGTTQTTSGLGGGQTWSVVTASRAKGTTYTNSTGRPILCTVICGAAANRPGCYVYIDGSIVMGNISIYHYSECVTFVVPRGSTYRVDGGGGLVINSWAELS